jgi:hypothetical protein
MAEVLRPFVLLLVLLNLVFVHLTGVVDLSWLVPLYALTLASPLLCRLQHRLVYRLSWNLAVLVLSMALLRHALTTGLLHMLEDGLVLAALCQVHVLNNVGARQRPDLLFFNSFLIAFVTSFFCQDAAYSGVFLAYAAVLLPSLQLFAVLRNGGAPSRSLVVGVLRDSVPRTALVLTCTGLVFLFWPRNFDREGWLESRFDFAGRRLEVGFTEEVRLGRSGDVGQSDAEVMRVSIQQGDPEVVPRHWRGATFVDLHAGGWAAEPNPPSPASSSDQEWQQVDGTWQRNAGRPEATLTVHLRDPTGQRLFLPLHAGKMEMWPADEGPALPHSDGTFGFQREPGRNYATHSLVYRVTACRAPARPAPVSPLLVHRLDFVEEDLMPREMIEGLVRQIRAEQTLLPTASDAEVARAFERWLATNRTYALPGDNAARGITEFLTGAAGGHCEYFATTLALLLRHEHIGCRVVTGYLASEWDASGQELIIRRKHAHAWVEAMLPGVGWATLDATPASDSAGTADHGGSWWSALLKWIERCWNDVTGFDQKARARAIAWLLALPAQLWVLSSAHPVQAFLSTAVLCFWLWLRRRRHTLPAGVRELRRAARKAGLKLRPGETPRELLARAPLTLADQLRQRLADAAEAHERLRYGSTTAEAT